MKFEIVYDSPGRLRLRCGQNAFSMEQEEGLVQILSAQEEIHCVQANSINGSILILYENAGRDTALKIVQNLSRSAIPMGEIGAAAKVNREFRKKAFKILGKRLFVKLFLPLPCRRCMALLRAVSYFLKGVKCLAKGKLGVDVLDAVSILASMLSGSFETASSVMLLLDLSTLLEKYTRKSATTALSDSLAIHIDTVWKVSGPTVEKVSLKDVAVGDVIRVQSGSVIPVDGGVISGECMVNEAAMTGEAIPVKKEIDSSVYAGTVIEEGNVDILVKTRPDKSRIHKIIQLIDTSEALKAGIQSRAEQFADRIVPFSFLAFLGVAAFTGNWTKAAAVLMVDYSCAIKLSTPICIITAMRDAANHQIMVKGGKYLENFEIADTIVFDKTGTLTSACPTVANIIPFEGYSRDEILKISACLEEHFPHSIARAVVKCAQEKNLQHREEHAKVEYVVAHGIASWLHGHRVLIGSAHFIFEDEAVELTQEKQQIIAQIPKQYSLLYLAMGKRLIGVLCIEDPVREEAVDVIKNLRKRGITSIFMLTGDGQSAAEAVRKKLGITKYYAKMLPEEKSKVIQQWKENGHKVIMVGDGINDSPALAAADVSVAMKDSSDIAREVADITLLSSSLEGLVWLRDLGSALFCRMHWNYRFILLFNSALLLCGASGILSPSVSALLHNLSTMGICASSMRPFLPKGEKSCKKQRKKSIY